jgi:Flp pilus assembly protein TadD
MTTRIDRPRAEWALAAGGFVCLLLAWGNTLPNTFHFDDAHVLENNVYLRSLRNVPLFFTDARTYSAFPGNCTYRPLVSVSLAVDYALAGGLFPRVFHASQIAWLVLLWLALIVFYERLLNLAWRSKRNRLIALFAATLFSVHTVQSEAMNLMHVRSEILSALGLVLALILYLGSRWCRRSGIYLAPMVVGALAKDPAVLLGPLLALLHLLFISRPGGSLWPRVRTALRASMPAMMVGAVTFVFVERMAAPGQTYGGGDRVAYALTQLWAWLHYLRLFVLPAGLTADTDLDLIHHVWDTRVFAGLLAIAALAVVAIRTHRRRRERPVAFGVVWFAIALGPTSTILPLAEPVNEHRVFLPFIGLVLAVVWTLRLRIPAWLARWILSPRIRSAILLAGCLVPIAALVTGSRLRNHSWRTAESLWGDVVQKSPHNGRGWMNYGLALMSRGDLEGARRCYQQALPLTPNYSILEVNLGIVEGALGKPREAEAHFRRALALAPSDSAPRAYYARWLVEKGRSAEAISRLDEAIRLAPADLMALTLRMELSAARGDAAGSAAAANRLLAADPASLEAQTVARGAFPLPEPTADSAACFRQGIVLGQKQSFVASAMAYRAALALKPDSADALNNLGWTLGQLGFFDEAVAPLRRAVELRPDLALARNNLAWVESQIRGRSPAP